MLLSLSNDEAHAIESWREDILLAGEAAAIRSDVKATEIIVDWVLDELLKCLWIMDCSIIWVVRGVWEMLWGQLWTNFATDLTRLIALVFHDICNPLRKKLLCAVLVVPFTVIKEAAPFHGLSIMSKLSTCCYFISVMTCRSEFLFVSAVIAIIFGG